MAVYVPTGAQVGVNRDLYTSGSDGGGPTPATIAETPANIAARLQQNRSEVVGSLQSLDSYSGGAARGSGRECARLKARTVRSLVCVLDVLECRRLESVIASIAHC